MNILKDLENKNEYRIFITIDNILDIMKNVKTILFYEYYDYIEVIINYENYLEEFNLLKDDDYYYEKQTWCRNKKLILKIENENEINFYLEYQKKIFNTLPLTNLEIFGYTSRFPSEINYDCLIDIPSSLKVIILEHFKGLNINNVKNIYCYPLIKIDLEENEYILDDTKKYKLIKNKWIKI